MKRMTSIATLLCLLGACASSQQGPDFESMTDAELYAYNMTQPLMKQVACYERIKTGSHIKKTHCDTLEDIIADNTDGPAPLSVLHVGDARFF